jgi:hypothetical protein
VVVMRTPTQIGISNTHMVSLTDLIKGFNDYSQKERFIFLNRVFSKSVDEISSLLKCAVRSQGASKRIGIYVPSAQVEYYYAIQGVYGDIEYDERVVRNITTTIDDVSPRYAIHFTKLPIALAIINKTETKSHRPRKNGKSLTPGSICRFDRAIHAITNIEKTDTSFVIAKSLKDIRDRMTHGISDEAIRQKYEAGLIFDIQKLAFFYKGHRNILINELGTLLVLDDIPADCIICCIHTDEDLNTFWRGS